VKLPKTAVRGATLIDGITWADALNAVTENRSAKGMRARKCFL
jgi:hypothetical protein